MASKPKTVFMITYVFPPAAWVGGHRTLKYCKYLGQHGWRPIVLTARPSGMTFKDEKLLSQLPAGTKVHRTFDVDPAKWEERLAERKLRRRRSSGARMRNAQQNGSANNHDGGSSTRGSSAGPGENPKPTLMKRMLRSIKSLVKESPDSHIFWIPFAVLRGLWILLTTHVDVIYSTSPPHSSHVIAFMLARLSGKPYVLDFRDPWYVTGSAREPRDKVPGLLRLETFAKRVLVRNAAQLICVSRGEQAELQAEFPELDPARFTFITNGFDPSDFAGDPPQPEQHSSKVRLIHAGTIYPLIAREFFEALRILVREHPQEAQRLEVDLLGDISDEFTDTVRDLEAAGVVCTHGMQPHARTLRMMQESDALLILMGGDKFRASHLPAKGFEYLQAGKPILAIARPGEFADMAIQSGLGIVVSPDSIDGIVRALRDLCHERDAGRLERTPNTAYIKAFERAALAGRLATVLDSVATPDASRT